MQKIKIIIFPILLISIGFGIGFYFAKSQNPPVPIEGIINQAVGQPEGTDFSLFWDAWRTLEEKFVNPKMMDKQKMIFGAISGMVSAIGDPYTVFFNPEENKKFIEDVEGTFEGIGAEIGLKKGQLVIVAPLEGTPAQEAGLMPGDQLLKINDKSAIDFTIEEAVSLIRGPKGTEVTLTIFRDSWDAPKDITITRGVIELPSLKWEIRKDGIAYIRLYQFSAKASSDFKKAASEILKKSSNKLILDLRNNPGGYLEVSREIASWFIKEGDLVVYEDFGGKREKNEFKALGNPQFLNWNIVVLVNEGSASASEILAGALRDNRGIKLVGEKTFGKGSVQEITNLDKDSSIKITVAKWFTPKGISINEQGLEPDIKIEITEDDIKNNKDSQLEKAVETLK